MNYPSVRRGDEGDDPVYDEPAVHGEGGGVLQPRARQAVQLRGK